MKIGLVAPYNVLTLSEGASIRVFELARGLNYWGASVYVLHHGPTKTIKSGLEFINIRSFGAFPNSGNYLHPINPSYPKLLRTFIKMYNVDIIQCEQPWSTFPTLLLARTLQIPCVLDEHNVEFLWTIKASKVPFLAPANFALEKLSNSFSCLVLATSEADKKLLMQIYNTPEEKIFVIPNGVNMNRFTEIILNQSQLKKKLGLNTTRKTILFHGMMSAKQNYEAAQLILDFIAPNFPNVTFIIIGKNPPLRITNKAKKQKNVRILGYVPNIEEFIMASDLCIVPIRRGSGTRLKLMEYLAAGKPIVSTIIGAEGLPIRSGVQAILCEDVNSDFIDAMRNILENVVLSQELSVEAKKLAEKLTWKDVTRSLYELYKVSFQERLVN
jgi:glycosyltransferase involved in cell wall biosynthesis